MFVEAWARKRESETVSVVSKIDSYTGKNYNT